MGKVDMIRLNADIFESSKVKYIRRLPDGDRILLVWVMMIAKATKCDINGMIMISSKVPYTVDTLADELGFDESLIRLALKVFEDLELARVVDEKILIEEWKQYLIEECAGAEERLAMLREKERLRKQAQRERKKLEQQNEQLLLGCVQATEVVAYSEQTKEEPKEKKKTKAKPKEQTITDPYFEDEKLNTTFKDFMDMRKSLKDGKMTDRAIKMMIKKLNRYDIDTAIAMLERSILNNWKDVYEITEKKAYNSYNNSYNKPQQKSISQMCDDIMNDFSSMGDAW